MTPQHYYSFYEADDTLSLLSDELIRTILSFKPIAALDFGSGSGKHSAVLNKHGVCTMALDISKVNTCIAAFKHGLPCVILGDETYLRHLANIDVVFTCSVLDHIEKVDGIIGEFKRIANKAVILAEPSIHDPEMMYFAHDYASMGFVKQDFSYASPADGNTYFIWVLNKEHDLDGMPIENDYTHYKGEEVLTTLDKPHSRLIIHEDKQ